MENKGIMTETVSWSLEEKERTRKMKIDAINNRLIDRIGELVTEGIDEIELRHGFKLISSSKLFEDFFDICYCDEIQEYLMLDNELKIHRYSVQGRPIQPFYILNPNMVFNKLTWCPGIKILACYIPDNDLIWILSPDCKLIQLVKNEFKVEQIFYSTPTEELIVVGRTTIAKYFMNHLHKILVAHDTIGVNDEDYGPLWKLQCSTLIPKNSNTLKLAASYLTTIYIIPLDRDEDEETDTAVEFSAKKLKASVSVITAIHFDDCSQWIIVGDQQGNVSGWTLNFDRVLNYLEGDKGAINIIKSHPSLCGFITSSDDNVLQVWSCNFRERTESFYELGVVTSMAVNKTTCSLVTLGDKMSFLHMNQLYMFFAPLTSPANILFSTNSPINSTRIIVCSAVGIISILSSFGRQLSIINLPPKILPLSAAYSTVTDELYIVTHKLKEIIVYNVKESRIKLRKTWSSEKKITSIAVYDNCDSINRNQGEIKGHQRARIIIGTSTGQLVSLEESTGAYEHVVQAHEGIVRKIYPSTASQRVLSIGEENHVKIWRMLPNIEVFIVPLHCIYYTFPITDIASMGSTICVVSSTQSLKKHQLLTYDMNEKINNYHSSSQDHTAEIFDVATSETLLICGTASKDSTIRIWDNKNTLLKVLDICVPMRKIAFSSTSGDIVFSLGKHLHYLPYENYLSPKYRALIKSNKTQEEVQEREGSMLNSEDYNECEQNIDEKKILHAVSSVPLGNLDPCSDIPRLDLVIHKQMCAKLKLRDEDISKIKESSITTQRKLSRRKACTNDEEWQRYVDNLLNANSGSSRNITRAHDVWKIRQKYLETKKIPNKETLITVYKNMELLEEINPKSFIGFIPNSLIVKRVQEEDETSEISYSEETFDKDKEQIYTNNNKLATTIVNSIN